MGVLPRNPRSIPKPSILVLDNRQTTGWAMDGVGAAASVVALVETFFEGCFSLRGVLFPRQECQSSR